MHSASFSDIFYRAKLLGGVPKGDGRNLEPTYVDDGEVRQALHCHCCYQCVCLLVDNFTNPHQLSHRFISYWLASKVAVLL